MRKSRFADTQILDAVKRVEAGIGVPDLCRDMGISTATFYKWRAKYGKSTRWHGRFDDVAYVRA